MALNEHLLEELRYKGEGTDVDYKAERPKFIGASETEKAELLKDILAMANAHRIGTAYILYGFKEDPPNPPHVVGLPLAGAIDDSRIQQFVNEKLDTKLNFRYEERMHHGKHIAVISIPKQPRPFTLKKPYGGLERDVVYIRRGSATDTASAREIAMMGASDLARPPARVELEFRGEDNMSLGQAFDLEFLESADEYPDYERQVVVDPLDFRPVVFSPYRDNRDFWREAANFVITAKRLVRVRLKVNNHSEFALTGAKLEVRVVGQDGTPTELLPYNVLPEVPRRSDGFMPHAIHRPIMLDPNIVVDRREGYPVCSIHLGALLPGDGALPADDLAVLPDRPGSYIIIVRMLAQEITPLSFQHEFDVRGDSAVLDIDMLESIVNTSTSPRQREAEGED